MVEEEAERLILGGDIASGTILGANIASNTLSNTQIGLAASAGFAPANPTGVTGTTLLMQGLGSTIAYTPLKTGIIKITLSALASNATAGDGFSAKMAYGTGAAPANGAAISGTVVGNIVTGKSAAASQPNSISIIARVSGLTAGTAIWVDIQLAADTAATVASLANIECVIEELLA
jgi:hypothetical protein